jgi:hypothetical protein
MNFHKIKCQGINKVGKNCLRYKVENSYYCECHQYFADYTPEMLQSLHLCKLCKLMRFIKDAEQTKCDVCINSIVNCAYKDCRFKRSVENKYCKKHQIGLFLDEVKEEGKKVCYQYIRGCRSKLDMEYPFSKCSKCLEIERKKDHIKRNKAKTSVVTEPNSRICTTCCIKQPKDEFISEKDTEIETKTCLKCRTRQKTQDERRDKEHRNELARIASKNPQRIEVKEKWREDNYEKVTETWMKSRDKRVETMGIEEYLLKNAEDAKRWRENNPDKCKENNEKRKNNIDYCYLNYVRSAEYKNLKFELTEFEYKSIVQHPCYYCGTFKEGKLFSGVDRKDQSIGYTVSNCVPCCEMCNYMKKSLSENVFIKRIEHILLYNKLINGGEYYPHIFANHRYITYNGYRVKSLEKNFDFQITEEQFYDITSGKCYICGKIPSNIHKNGIDRFNSSIGYVFENCRCCCGECNYMKNNYDYGIFVDKLKTIHTHYNSKQSLHEVLSHSVVELTNISTQEVFKDPLSETLGLASAEPSSIIKKIVKKTKEQIKEEARIRKQKQIARLKEKIGDEEYRKKKAFENATERQKRKNELGEEEFNRIQKEKMARYRENRKGNNQTDNTDIA